MTVIKPSPAVHTVFWQGMSPPADQNPDVQFVQSSEGCIEPYMMFCSPGKHSEGVQVSGFPPYENVNGSHISQSLSYNAPYFDF